MPNLTDFEQREIKSKAVSEEELQEMYALSKSYEALFSKKSTQIKERNIDVKSLQEEDFKKLSKDPNLYEKIYKSIAPGIYGN